MSAGRLTGSLNNLEPRTVSGCLYNLIRHPYKTLCRRWNWKSALMSAIIRGLIFFFTNIVAGLGAAVGAMLIEFAFRIVTSGFYGAMTQCFRRAEPAWAAAVCAVVILPIANHAPELAIHWASGTPELTNSVGASLLFTVLSTLFNLYAMRKGAMVVGPHCRPLLEDLRRMPRIVVGFVSVAPVAFLRLIKPYGRKKPSRAESCAD
jgi:hypothetical protein